MAGRIPANPGSHINTVGCLAVFVYPLNGAPALYDCIAVKLYHAVGPEARAFSALRTFHRAFTMIALPQKIVGCLAVCFDNVSWTI